MTNLLFMKIISYAKKNKAELLQPHCSGSRPEPLLLSVVVKTSDYQNEEAIYHIK